MKGSLHKTYDFSTIILKEDLITLNTLLKSKFNECRYTIKTEDGGNYDIESLDEILSYDNLDDRKIIHLQIKCNKQNGDSFICPNLSISLLDNSLYDKSCIIDLHEMEETEIVYFTKKINEFTIRIKAPYWWLHKNVFYIVSGIILYLIFSVLYLTNVDNHEAYNKVYNILVLQSISVFCMVIAMLLGKKLISYIFPESCFCIGDQERFYIKRTKFRNIIFWTILISIILGIVSSIISHFIIKIYLS